MSNTVIFDRKVVTNFYTSYKENELNVYVIDDFYEEIKQHKHLKLYFQILKFHKTSHKIILMRQSQSPYGIKDNDFSMNLTIEFPDEETAFYFKLKYG